MESLYFLVPIALIFVAIAIRILLWAINSGQYDNLDTEAHRILFDEDKHAADTTPSADISTTRSSPVINSSAVQNSASTATESTAPSSAKSSSIKHSPANRSSGHQHD